MRTGPLATHTAALSFSLLLAPSALAQATDARSVLQATSDALASIESGTARWTVDGIAPPGMFADLKGSGSGSLEWIRQGETRAVQFTGRLQRTTKAEPEQTDFVLTTDRATALVTDEKLFVERDPNARPHAALVTPRKLMHDFWVEEVPFSFELERAESIDFDADEPTASVSGETCDVIEIRLPELNPADKTKFPRRGANLIRLFVAQSDSLPRRIEHINENSMLTIGDVVIFNDLQTNAMLTTADVLHTLPAGWRVDSTLPAERRTEAPTAGSGTPPGAAGGTETPATPPAVIRPTAVDFAFTTEDGREITRDGQRGRVTVLYFWGSWCLPCKQYSPMVSDIAFNAAEAPVDVFGLTVRERNAETPRSIMNENGYRHALVLGADEIARDFNIRVYPSMVVLDKQGRRVASVSPTQGKSPDDVMQEVRDAVELAAGES